MKKNNFKKSMVVYVLILLFAVFIVNEFTGVFKSEKEVIINIPNGASVSTLGSLLKDNKLISSEILFKVYSKTQDGIIKSGSHTFTSRSYSELYKTACENSTDDQIRLTITEGMEFYKIAELIEEKGLASYDDVLKEAKLSNFDYWFLKDITPRKYELEGYIYPDTYIVSKGQTVHEILDCMLSNFDNKFDAKMKKRAEEINMSVDEIITLASIVEREAASKDELDLVAGVFYNRINKKGESVGLLESCATVQYILEERKEVLSVADTNIKSAYNTYVVKGLPIGPIASPGLNAINAALYPKKSDYLYFVADGSGKHLFSETFSEHQSNMRKVGL